MDSIGIDVHKNNSQVCILTEAGELIERRVSTSRARFAAVLGGRERAFGSRSSSSVIDRIVHHATVLKTEGDSYRLRAATRKRRGRRTKEGR